MTGGTVRQEQPVEPVVELPEWTLNASDMCDKRRCGARAYWRFVHKATLHELTFCGHDGVLYEPLLGDDYLVFDERAQLDVKLGGSV